MTTARGAREVVVMVTTSYPRFPGDGVGSFMAPIAQGLVARGHEVHVVAPWHPRIRRAPLEDGVWFHFFHYAPVARWHVFGYAAGMQADTAVRPAAWAMAPAAFAAGGFKAWRVRTKRRATVIHGHWVVPGGVMAAMAAGPLPLVISLHGSDMFVAEHHATAGAAARRVFRRAGWVTAPSDDLRTRGVALGADPARSSTVPYGVDATRFGPDPAARVEVRRALGIGDAPLVVAAGRLVRKKGFEYLIAAAARLRERHPALRVVIAGSGDLQAELAARIAREAPETVRLAADVSQDEVARLFAAADVVAVPSVRDEAGNVDGLPNTALEALASATPVVATTAGGLPQAITDGVDGRLVAPSDAPALGRAIDDLLSAPDAARRLGAAGRRRVVRDFGWDRVAAAFEAAYVEARARGAGAGKKC